VLSARINRIKKLTEKLSKQEKDEKTVKREASYGRTFLFAVFFRIFFK
jgi:hypothetical protein